MIALLVAQESGGSVLPTVGLLIALVLFVAIVAWVFLVPKEAWRRDAEIPLENDVRSRAREGTQSTEKHHG